MHEAFSTLANVQGKKFRKTIDCIKYFITLWNDHNSETLKIGPESIQQKFENAKLQILIGHGLRFIISLVSELDELWKLI